MRASADLRLKWHANCARAEVCSLLRCSARERFIAIAVLRSDDVRELGIISAVGTKRTCRLCCAMSALRSKAENICSHRAFPVLTTDVFDRPSRFLIPRRECPPVPKSQKIINLALSPAVILGRERIDAGIDADVTNKEIRALDKVSYLINSSPAETTCGSCHGRSPICLTPSIPILRR